MSLVFFSCEEKNSNLEEAERYFNSRNFQKAIPLYEKAFTVASNPGEQEGIQFKIEQSHFELAERAFSNKDFDNSVQFAERLLKQFPKTVYEKLAREIFMQSRIEIAIRWMKKKKYRDALESLSGLESYSQGLDKLKEQTVQLIAESLYQIAEEQLENQEYFLSAENLRVLTLEYSQTSWSQKAEKILETAYFRDAQEQMRRRAYSNALEIFKEFLVRYPNTEYQKEAEKNIREIETRLNSQSSDSKTELKITTQALEKKGLDEGSPYENEEIIQLIEELSSQKKKNTEYLVQEVFPKYQGRFVDLKTMEVLSYETISKPQLLSGKTRKWMDEFLGKKEEKENSPRYTDFSYQIRSKSLGNLLLFVSREDFFRLDFSGDTPKVDVQGQISELSLLTDKQKDQGLNSSETIQLQIVVLNLQQTQ